jgi:hypothetical protein
MPLGEELANVLLLACCYQEVSRSRAVIALTDDLHLIDKRAEIYRQDFNEMKATTAEFIAHQGIDAKGKKHLNVGSIAQQVASPRTETSWEQQASTRSLAVLEFNLDGSNLRVFA